jgi:hypothetical protein
MWTRRSTCSQNAEIRSPTVRLIGAFLRPQPAAKIIACDGTAAGRWPTSTVLEARRPALDVTVASALDRPPPLLGNRPIVRSPVDLELVVPLDRVGAGEPAADAAARVGRMLAGRAIEVLPADGAAGGRLGMERGRG